MDVHRGNSLTAVLTGGFLLVAGVLYGTGFLIASSLFGRLGVRETGVDFLKAEYVQIGVLYWALPLVILSPIAAMKIRHKATQFPGTDAQCRVDAAVTIPVVCLLVVLVATFYVLAIFAPPGFISDDPTARMWITAFLYAVIGTMVLMVLNAVVLERLSRGLTRLSKEEAPHREVPRLTKWLFAVFNRVRQVLVATSIVVYLVFASAFVFLLRDRFYEMGVGHGLPTLALVAIMALQFLIVIRMVHRRKAYADNQRRLIAFWTTGMPLVGLLWYLSLLAFAHSICLYIPATRGGGDFTTMPEVILHFKLEAGAPKGSIGSLEVKNGVSEWVVLIRENADTLYVAVPRDGDGPVEWRRYATKPRVWAIQRDQVSTIEYKD